MAVRKTPHTRSKFKVVGESPPTKPPNHTTRPIEPKSSSSAPPAAEAKPKAPPPAPVKPKAAPPAEPAIGADPKGFEDGSQFSKGRFGVPLDVDRASELDEDCEACQGYGYFDKDGKPSILPHNRRCRACDGSGQLQPNGNGSSAEPLKLASHLMPASSVTTSSHIWTGNYICDVCGYPFSATRKDARFCRPTCRKIMSRFHSRETNIGALTLFCEMYPLSRIAKDQAAKAKGGGA